MGKGWRTRIPSGVLLACVGLLIFPDHVTGASRRSKSSTHGSVPGHKREIYLTANSSGKAGDGTKENPYDASTAEKYTAILQKYQPYYFLHYEPGTYETYGWLFMKRRTAGTGCRHFGAGIDKTIIRLVGASNGTADGTVFASDYNVRADGFEVQDMTIDCNAAAQPKWNNGPSRFAAAIQTRGSRIAIKRVKVVGFGTRSKGTECFPLFIYSDALAGVFENCVVEDCIVSDPATGNLDGVSSIALGVSAPKAFGRRLVARNNTVDLTGNDFLYSHGPSAPLSEGNFVKGCTDGFYMEPPVGDCFSVVRRNHFVDCGNGVGGSAHRRSMAAGCLIEKNVFKDCHAAVRIGGHDEKTHYREVTVRDNHCVASEDADGAAGLIEIRCTDKAVVERNVLDGGILVSARRRIVNENRTSKGELLNYLYNGRFVPQAAAPRAGSRLSAESDQSDKRR